MAADETSMPEGTRAWKVAPAPIPAAVRSYHRLLVEEEVAAR